MIINRSRHEVPEYSTRCSAGMDILANLEEDIVLKPLERKVIPTGLYLEIPAGNVGQTRPRSGLPIHKGISVLNSPGTIDADYRDEVCVKRINLSDQDFNIIAGDRICQMIILKQEKADWIDVEVVEKTDTGSGGFGHTCKV